MTSLHIYGTDHSPWVHSVLLALHIHNIHDYTLSATPSLATMVESYKQKQITPYMMPAMWYKGKCYYESYDIIRMIQNKIATEQPLTKPNLFDYNGFENLVEMDKLNLKYIFTYAMTRVLGLKKEFQFWHEWAVHKDKPTSQIAGLVTPLLRPLTTLYMFSLLNYNIFTMNYLAPEEVQKQTGIDKAGWVINRCKNSIKYFSGRLNTTNGKYLYGDDITAIDLQLLGHFQCMFSGTKSFGPLSEEVIPIIDEYPNLWTWLKNMHMHPSLKNYDRFYTRIHSSVSRRLGTTEEDMNYEAVRADWFHFLEYYLGMYGLATIFPLTSLSVVGLSVILSRFAPNVRKEIQNRLFLQSKL